MRTELALVLLWACSPPRLPWQQDWVAREDHRDCDVYCELEVGFASAPPALRADTGDHGEVELDACVQGCQLAKSRCPDELAALQDCRLARRLGYGSRLDCEELRDSLEQSCEIDLDPPEESTP